MDFRQGMIVLAITLSIFAILYLATRSENHNTKSYAETYIAFTMIRFIYNSTKSFINNKFFLATSYKFLIFTDIEDREKIIYKIPYSDITKINYYKDLKPTNENSTIKNAIIGGLIAGSVGAVVGSNVKENSNKSIYFLEIYYTENNKDKQIILSYVDKTKSSFILKEIINYASYYDLKPVEIDFEYSLLYDIKSKEGNVVSNNADIPEQIKKLSKLKDDGIITEDEFKESKEKLLAQI